MEDRERRPTVAKNEEATEEGSTEDVELHRRSSFAQTDSDAPAEGEADDDVELHRKQSMA